MLTGSLPRPTRRQLGVALGALLLGGAGPASSAPVAPPERVRVGLLMLELPRETERTAPPPGWDWAGSGPEGMEILVRGRTSFPTPDLAVARVLAPRPAGDVAWVVTGNPPQGIVGTTSYRVWNVRSTVEPVRTGVLAAATLEGETAVLLLTGPDGWSPSLRRSVLSGLEVSRAS